MAELDLLANKELLEEFNRLNGAERVVNPYPGFSVLRSVGSVVRVRKASDSEPAAYVTTTYAAASAIMMDVERFSSSEYEDSIGKVVGHTLLSMDPPEHGRYRQVFQRPLRQRRGDWEQNLIRPIAVRLVDELVAKGEGDLMQEITLPLPIEVIGKLIGIPDEMWAPFYRWSIELLAHQANAERGQQASENLAQLYSNLLLTRAKAPEDDLASDYAQVMNSEPWFKIDAIVDFFRLLGPAAIETSYRSMSSMLFGLLSHPPEWERLQQASPQQLDATLEEALRWESPLTGAIYRVAKQDAVVDGVEIPRGAIVFVNLGAANHDPSRWANPDEFCPGRARTQHIAFGAGPHHCVGRHLALSEARVVLATLLERAPNITLAADAEDVRIVGRSFRSPTRLPVVLSS